MRKVALLPHMVYLIDDRPGEEIVLACNAQEAINLFKTNNPHLREVKRKEYNALRRRMNDLDGKAARDEP